jgi:hypothetical protein
MAKTTKPLKANRESIIEHLSELATESDKDSVRIAALAEMSKIEGLNKGAEKEGQAQAIMLVPFAACREQWVRLCQSYNAELLKEVEAAPIPKHTNAAP